MLAAPALPIALAGGLDAVRRRMRRRAHRADLLGRLGAAAVLLAALRQPRVTNLT